MAMPQQDDYIEQIRRLEGLMAYAETGRSWSGSGSVCVGSSRRCSVV